MTRVVGAAVIQAGRVLAARRTEPPHLAGQWEFPGGKVETGESDAVALARECREELGVDVLVGAPLIEVELADGWLLVIYRCALAGIVPTASNDHDQLRWLSADQLGELDWVPGDRPALPQLAALLG